MEMIIVHVVVDVDKSALRGKFEDCRKMENFEFRENFEKLKIRIIFEVCPLFRVGGSNSE